MARKDPKKNSNGKKGPRSLAGDPSDPRGMLVMLDRFLEWMRTKNYSEATIETRSRHIGYFINWGAERSVTRPAEVTKPILERYQRYLYLYRKRSGEPLSFRTQHAALVPLRAWFKWLTRQNHILYNPASELELPRLERRLPKHVLTIREAETVLAKADITDPLGLRDRAILETFYSTGMRRLELIGLKLFDMDVDRGTVMIRQGKGKKDRMIPIGERALQWIERYITDVRPHLVVNANDMTLFLTHTGEPFRPGRLSQVVSDYIDKAEIGKTGSCHLFRHTMATLMLENGADIRFIQAMLGHVKLDTTQIYTQVSIRKLKKIHELTHPAKLKTEGGGQSPETEGEDNADVLEDEATTREGSMDTQQLSGGDTGINLDSENETRTARDRDAAGPDDS